MDWPTITNLTTMEKTNHSVEITVANDFNMQENPERNFVAAVGGATQMRTTATMEMFPMLPPVDQRT